MTITTRNEAAERLFKESAGGLTDRQFRTRLREVLAAERRATVERIRDELLIKRNLLDEDQSEVVSYVLDEEMAR
jgi:hypothetical protein